MYVWLMVSNHKEIKPQEKTWEIIIINQTCFSGTLPRFGDLVKCLGDFDENLSTKE